MMFPAQPAAAQPVMPPPGPPPMGPAPAGPAPVRPAPVGAPAGAKKSSKVPLIAVGGVVVVGGAIAAVLLLRGGGGGGLGSQDDVVKQSIAAMGAGDIDALAKLADVESLMSRALDCGKRAAKDDDDDMDGGKQARKLRRKFERDSEKIKGLTLEVVEIEKEPEDGGKKRGKMLEKGDKAGEGCIAKTDLAMHRVKAKLKVKQGDKPPRDGTAEVEVIEVDGRWYLGDPPRIKAGLSCEPAVARALKDTRKELQQLPQFSEAWMAKLEEAVLHRCKVDQWSDEALGCIVDEDRVSNIDFCFKKLSTEHQKALQDDMMRAIGLGQSATPEPPVTPTPPPSDDPPPPPPDDLPEDGKEAKPDTPATGGLADVGMPDCEAYRRAMVKLVSCSALPPGTRDLYKKALTSLTSSWAAISGTTAAAVKKSMNDMCRRSIATLRSPSTAGCL